MTQPKPKTPKFKDSIEAGRYWAKKEGLDEVQMPNGRGPAWVNPKFLDDPVTGPIIRKFLGIPTH